MFKKLLVLPILVIGAYSTNTNRCIELIQEIQVCTTQVGSECCTKVKEFTDIGCLCNSGIEYLVNDPLQWGAFESALIPICQTQNFTIDTTGGFSAGSPKCSNLVTHNLGCISDDMTLESDRLINALGYLSLFDKAGTDQCFN